MKTIQLHILLPVTARLLTAVCIGFGFAACHEDDELDEMVKDASNLILTDSIKVNTTLLKDSNIAALQMSVSTSNSCLPTSNFQYGLVNADRFTTENCRIGISTLPVNQMEEDLTKKNNPLMEISQTVTIFSGSKNKIVNSQDKPNTNIESQMEVSEKTRTNIKDLSNKIIINTFTVSCPPLILPSE